MQNWKSENVKLFKTKLSESDLRQKIFQLLGEGLINEAVLLASKSQSENPTYEISYNVIWELIERIRLSAKNIAEISQNLYFFYNEITPNNPHYAAAQKEMLQLAGNYKI